MGSGTQDRTQGIILEGTNFDDCLVGGDGNDLIKGYDGNDHISGGKGADTMIGGAGNDIYFVDNVGDIIEDTEGKDYVFSSVDYTLTTTDSFSFAGGPEVLELSGNAIRGIGNSLDNNIAGNKQNNYLDGLLGNDQIFGKDGNDTLVGGAGNDYLSGGSGADLMVGGSGNDVYVVDTARDIIKEKADEGYDRIKSYVDYTLSDNVEKINIVGDAVRAFGNASDNRIFGNNHDNLLLGNAGNDYIEGGKGNDVINGGVGDDKLNAGDGDDFLFGKMGDDTLYGGNGNDYMSGGLGANVLFGGAGNDRYIIRSTADRIIDTYGYDSVHSSVDFTLAQNVEKLTLIDLATIGVGSDQDNKITGNDQDNILQGKKGNDYLQGNAGNDTYVFNMGDGLDRIVDAGADANDKVLFGPNVQQEDIAFFATEYSLNIKYGVGDVVTVRGYKTPDNAIESFELNSGLSADVNAIINHIATYEANNAVNFSGVDDVSNDAQLMQEIQVYWS